MNSSSAESPSETFCCAQVGQLSSLTELSSLTQCPERPKYPPPPLISEPYHFTCLISPFVARGAGPPALNGSFILFTVSYLDLTLGGKGTHLSFAMISLLASVCKNMLPLMLSILHYSTNAHDTLESPGALQTTIVTQGRQKGREIERLEGYRKGEF